MAQKINADVMKQNNRKEVLRFLRKEPCSRIKLAKKLGLTRAAISFICEELINDGLLVEGEKEASIGGRPATVLRLNANYGVYGGVHFTRNDYKVGICDFTGKPKLRQDRFRKKKENSVKFPISRRGKIFRLSNILNVHLAVNVFWITFPMRLPMLNTSRTPIVNGGF